MAQLNWDIMRDCPASYVKMFDMMFPNPKRVVAPAFLSYFGDSRVPSATEQKLSGTRPEMIIIDDLYHQETTVTKSKPLKKDYNTVGVRFIYGHNLAKIYTYRVRKGAKLHLGQEVVVPSAERPNSVAVVVEIHKTPQDTGPFNYLFVTGKVAPL